MNNKMIKLSDKIFDLIGEYIKEYREQEGDPFDIIYIVNNKTGEIMVFAEHLQKLKDCVKLIK